MVLATLLLVPTPGLETPAHRLLAVVAFTVILWICETIPLAITALLGPALAVALGVGPAKEIFAPFAHPLIFLFVGAFILARALSVHGFDRRAALWLLSRGFVAGSPQRAMTAVAVTAFSFSMWINNTATTAMMMPIVLGLCASIREACPDDPKVLETHGRYAEGMLICTAYAASLGGICTPVGTAPNLIAIAALDRFAGVTIDFFQWMSFGVPIGSAALIALLVFARFYWRPAVSEVTELDTRVRREFAELGPMSPKERRSVAIFGLAVVGWLVPSLIRLGWGPKSELALWAKSSLPEGVVAITAAALLFVVGRGAPSNGASPQPLMTWSEAQRIDWGTVYLLGGGLALGSATVSTGLAEAVGNAVGAALGGAPPQWLLIVVVSILVIYLTELVSNTATTNMMLPIAIPLALAAGHHALPVALAVALAASFAFMLPVSTPPNAIVYGSGLVELKSMLRAGIWMNLLALALLIFMGIWVLPAIRFQ
ncbi:anion transporter [Plesiocystis pacifica SIR-1]|uniref:Anion transporter n=1 Tax=Plesiocystis pacifica SIR-1 TaxID=391625 RepID=A6G7M6_9BACT|nr:anion transporter [Plesiocystis pacifica SIR-1]